MMEKELNEEKEWEKERKKQKLNAQWDWEITKSDKPK